MRNQTNQMLQAQPSNASSDNQRILYIGTPTLKKALGYVFVLLGLPETQIPNKIYEDVLVNYVKDAFPNITIQDIKDAFHGAMSNKFLLDSSKAVNDMGLYGNLFSAEYFSKIMSAYLNYKRSLPSKQSAVDASKQLAEETPRTQEQLMHERIQSQDSILKFFEEHMKVHKKLPSIIDTRGLWSAIKRKDGFDLSKEKIEKVKVEAEDRLQTEINRAVNHGDRATAKNLREAWEQNLRFEMKKVYVEEYLLNQIPTDEQTPTLTRQ